MDLAAFGIEALAWAAVAVALAGLVHGLLGLGFPLVATPLVALVTDVKSAIVIVLLPTLTAVVISVIRGGHWRESLGRYWFLPLYMVAGSYLGARLLIAGDPAIFTLVLAAVIVVYLNIERIGHLHWQWVRARPALAGAAFGLAAGVSESTANVAAPALLIYFLMQDVSPRAMVQTLNFCFLAGKTTQGLTLAVAGGISASIWLATLPLAALGAVALLAGARVRERIDADSYRRWLRRAMAVMAAILFAQFLWQLARA